MAGMYPWHQRPAHRPAGVLVDGVALEQEEDEQVRGDRVHATFLERQLGFMNTEQLHLLVTVWIFFAN